MITGLFFLCYVPAVEGVVYTKNNVYSRKKKNKTH